MRAYPRCFCRPKPTSAKDPAAALRLGALESSLLPAVVPFVPQGKKRRIPSGQRPLTGFRSSVSCTCPVSLHLRSGPGGRPVSSLLPYSGAGPGGREQLPRASSPAGSLTPAGHGRRGPALYHCRSHSLKVDCPAGAQRIPGRLFSLYLV